MKTKRDGTTKGDELPCDVCQFTGCGPVYHTQFGILPLQVKDDPATGKKPCERCCHNSLRQRAIAHENKAA